MLFIIHDYSHFKWSNQSSHEQSRVAERYAASLGFVQTYQSFSFHQTRARCFRKARRMCLALCRSAGLARLFALFAKSVTGPSGAAIGMAGVSGSY